MEIVVAKPDQVDAMVAITEQAQANMAAMGIELGNGRRACRRS